MRLISAALLSLLLCLPQAQVQAQTHLVIISGLGGDEPHREKFYSWAKAMMDAASDRYGISDSNVVYLAERVERDPEGIDGRSTKENIENVLRDLARRARATDGVLILLIGHGSYQGEESRFSLPGPDMTPQDFATALSWFPTQSVAFVNTTSASGDFVEALSGDRRTIIVATRSPFERNETLFCRFFVEAFSEDVADVDHDERLSLLEAFEYARQEVSRFYESENRLLTEHAVLDDNGDGEGSGEPDPESSDGRVAASFLFDSRAAVVVELAAEDPELRALYQRQRVYQDSLALVRTLRDELETETYEEILERLLISLAEIARSIRERGGGG